MNALIADAAHGLALALIAISFAAACGAATARSLISLTAYLLVVSATAAAALLALRADSAALSLALLAVGFAPALLLATLLLTTRATRSRKSAPWVTIAAAAVACAVIAFAALRIGPQPHGAAIATGPISAWLAPLVFVAAVACIGLLGFGERGALRAREPGE